MSEFEFIVAEEKITAIVNKQKENMTVVVNNNEYSFRTLDNNLYQVKFNDKSYTVAAVKHKDRILVDIDSIQFELTESGNEQFLAGAENLFVLKDKVFAPMPGKIVKLLVNEGDRVNEKQPLAVVEAMKMENQIISPASGKVKAINHVVGDQVDTLSPIIELELEG